MEMKITTLEGKQAGSVDLPDAIFGLEPRADIVQRCVNWQLAKRQAGTHKTKLRGEVNRTTKKVYAQKGTGQARHGAASAPQFRGGGRAFGPVVRSHAHALPKKVRALALKHALSAKAKDGGIVVIEKAAVKDTKTKQLLSHFEKLGWDSGVLGHLEDDLVVLGRRGRLLGDHRSDQHVVMARIVGAHFKRATSASTAALVSTSLPPRMMS